MKKAKKITYSIIAIMFAASSYTVNAQAIIAINYASQLFGASKQEEARKIQAEKIKAEFEAKKVKAQELAKTHADINALSTKAKQESKEFSQAAQDENDNTYKEAKHQLEVAHIRAMGKISKHNSAAQAEEHANYAYELEKISTAHSKRTKSINEAGVKMQKDLFDKYKQEYLNSKESTV
jgi:hypothetical protein